MGPNFYLKRRLIIFVIIQIDLSVRRRRSGLRPEAVDVPGLGFDPRRFEEVVFIVVVENVAPSTFFDALQRVRAADAVALRAIAARCDLYRKYLGY